MLSPQIFNSIRARIISKEINYANSCCFSCNHLSRSLCIRIHQPLDTLFLLLLLLLATYTRAHYFFFLHSKKHDLDRKIWLLFLFENIYFGQWVILHDTSYYKWIYRVVFSLNKFWHLINYIADFREMIDLK